MRRQWPPRLPDSPDAADITASTQSQLTMSYAGAADIAAQYPQYATQITDAARQSFLAGDQWAYLAGIIAVLLGAALVAVLFPRRDEERRLLAEYHAEDFDPGGDPACPPAAAGRRQPDGRVEVPWPH